MEAADSSEMVLFFLMSTFMMSLVIYFAQWKLSRRHLYEMAAKIPMNDHVPILPLIGHAYSFFGNTEKILESLKIVCGPNIPPRTVWLAYRLFFTINRAEDMEVILNSPKCLSKDDLYKMSIPFGGNGLFNLPIPVWKKHRKAIMPTFHQRILDNFVEIFAIQAEICSRQVAKTNGKLIDLFPYVAKYGLDAVCETAMGVQINAQTTDSTFETVINKGMEIMMIRMFNVPYHFDFIYKWTRLAKKERACIQQYHGLIQKVVSEKKEAYRKKMLEQNNVVDSDDDLKRKGFLDMLIELSENGENWSDSDLLGEVSIFMIAGSDTGATVSGFTALMIAMHPDVQEKCYQEIIEVLGTHRAFTHTDLPKLIYLEKVIKESMRLFPVGPSIVRKVDDDIEVGGCVLPKGAGVVLGIIGVHYSETYYKDPLKFDPERFSPEETAKRHKYAYLPFSGGPRNCVGPKYGMMSLKTIVATLLRDFRFETTYKDIGDIRVKQSLIIKAVDGFPLRLIPRN